MDEDEAELDRLLAEFGIDEADLPDDEELPPRLDDEDWMTKALKKAEAKPVIDPNRLNATLVDGKLTIAAPRKEYERMAKAFGAISPGAQSLLVGQMIDTLRLAGTDADQSQAINVAVEMIEGIAPQTPAEALLAVQMVGAHMASMDMYRRVRTTDRVDFMAVYSNAATKFSRLFLGQMEGMAKMRRGGEQVVRHVHVGEGGQALIAGTVNTGGGR